MLNVCRFKEVFEEHKIDIDWKKLEKVESLSQLNELVTSSVYGYEDIEEYRRASYCKECISGVSIPVLCVNARDDPICSFDNLPLEEIQ